MKALHTMRARAGMQPISVVAPYLPTALHRKRDAARREIGRIFAGIIAKRRASGERGNDILQTFIDGRYARVNGGRELTEAEITGLLIAALFAGMHTSTITSSWTGIFLAANRSAWDACVDEQRRIVAEYGARASASAACRCQGACSHHVTIGAANARCQASVLVRPATRTWGHVCGRCTMPAA
jgi:cytochrome P450